MEDKIGRHGLGFNSIFNLTDLPSILSNDSILFLDPQVKYLRAVGASDANPGIRLRLSSLIPHCGKKAFELHPDQYEPYVRLV